MSRSIRWSAPAAIAGVTLFIGWLAFVALAPDAVYSGDFGVKFVQARELWSHRFASLAIEPRNTLLDPDGRFSPLKAPFVFATPSGIQAIFPPAASVLQAVFVSLGGLMGMRLLSLLAVAVTLWATWRLSPRGWAGAAIPIVTGLATPLWFYGVIESEHAPAIALAAVAFVVAMSPADGDERRKALIAGLALGAAASVRDECILLVPGLLLACWSRSRSWRSAAFALGGCIATLALAATVEVWWFGRPMAAHLRHAVHILRVALRLTSRPNEELPELHPLSLGERWDYVGQYWVFGVGSDAIIAALVAVVALSVAARAWFRTAWALVPALVALLAVASVDLFYLLAEPKWVPGLYRLSPFLVFAVIPPPPDVRERWLWRISLFSLVSYVVVAFAGVDTSGGKSLGPRLLLPLLPLLVASAWTNIADFVRAPRPGERVVGACGIALTVLALVVHVAVAVPAYVVRSNEDASAMRTIRGAAERVIVADDMYTAQQLLPMYYNRVILLAETPPAGHEIGMALERESISGAIMVSRNPDVPTGLAPLHLADQVQRGLVFIQYRRRGARNWRAIVSLMLRSKRSRYATSEKLFAASSRILPGGVDSPVRAFKSVGGSPLFIDRASGARIRDVDGNSYIDYVMSWGPLIHGHAPKGLLKALAATAARGTSFGAPTELETRLAQRVAMLMPSMERVRFVSSGTEATMSAVRVARAATKRDRIVKFEGCYHGHADPFLVQAGSGALTLGVPTSPGVPAAAAADTLLARYNDLASVEAVLDRHADQVAAIIVEPIAGNIGVVPPRDGFLAGLRTICDRRNVLLIFDEVISGFRASAGGAQRLFGIKPDLTCLGKIIGGGLPVGAYGGRAALMELVSPAGPVYQAGTLSGNPLAMTAGLWSLGELSPKLYRHLARLGGQLAAGLADAARDAGVALQVNAFGSLVTPFFTVSPVRDFQSAMTADAAMYGKFFRGMLARGIYPPPSQFEAWFLSGAHSERDVEQTVKAARATLREIS